MSWQATSAALGVTGISPSEKLLLLAVANYADEDGCAWPSQKKLATDTGLTDRTIRTLFVKLETIGLLNRERRHREDGYRATDRIQLTLDAPRKTLPEIISGEIDDNLTGNPLPILPETISDQEPVSRTTKEPPPKKRARARKPRPAPVRSRRCPTNWTPSADTIAKFTVAGVMPEQIQAQLEIFKDWEFRDPKSDWEATFRNWLRKAKPQRLTNGHPVKSPGLAKLQAVDAAMVEAVRLRELDGGDSRDSW